VNEGYFEHARFALLFATLLMTAALAAFVHAIIPAVCEKTASQIVQRLFEKSKNRGK
jgi:ABC-type transporter MlaC component